MSFIGLGNFAGGLASGIESGVKLGLAIRKQRSDEDKANAKVAAQGKVDYEAFNKEATIQNQNLIRANNALADPSNMTTDDYNKMVGEANASKSYFSTQRNNQNLSPAMRARLNSFGVDNQAVETQVLTTVDVAGKEGETTQVYLPASMANEKGLVLSENGTMGAYTMREDQTFDKTKVIPTNMKPLQFKAGADTKNSDMYKAWEEQTARLKAGGESPKSLEQFKTEDWTVKGEGRRDPLMQKNEAYADMVTSEEEYKANPTPENKRFMEHKQDTYTGTVFTKGEATERSEGQIATETMSLGRDFIKTGGKGFDAGKALNEETLFKGTYAYNKNTSLKKEEGAFLEKKVVYEQTRELYDVFSTAVKNGSYKSGLLDTPLKTIKSYSSEEFSTLVGMDRESIKKQIGLEGEIGDGVATYLKSLTGTASSQGEFLRTITNYVGNAFKPEDMREATFKSFTNKKKRDLDTQARSLMKRGLVGTAGEYLYGSSNTTKSTVTSDDMYEYKTINGKTYRKLKAK